MEMAPDPHLPLAPGQNPAAAPPVRQLGRGQATHARGGQIGMHAFGFPAVSDAMRASPHPCRCLLTAACRNVSRRGKRH